MTKDYRTIAIVSGLGLAGAFAVLLATRLGIGVPPDSTIYFDAARNLAHGRGFVVFSGPGVDFVTLTHYPPLYSSLLALGTANGATVETAARSLNAVLFAANILLVGISIAFVAPKSFWLPVIGAGLTLTASDVLAIHSVALTEPLYLALTLGGLLALGSYLQNQRRRFLLASSILVALSCLTKFVGVAAAVAGVIALLLLDRKHSLAFSITRESLRRKVVDILIFGTVSCAPLGLWSIRNRLVTGGTSDRQLDFHPVKFQQIVSLFSTAAQWLLLGKVRLDVRFLGIIIEILLLVGLGIYLMKNRRTTRDTGLKESRTGLPHLLTIFIIVYVAILVLTISFFEADDVLDSRSLLPVHLAFLVLAPCVCGLLCRRVPQAHFVRIVFVVLTLLLAGSYTFRTTRWLARAQADGQGYASSAWRESPSMAQISKLPSESRIYSNGVDAVNYLTGRRALSIPAKLVRVTGRPNSRYEVELVLMSEDLRAHGGVLVYFSTLTERWFLPSENELQSELPLTVVATLSDGTLYKLDLKSSRGH